MRNQKLTVKLHKILLDYFSEEELQTLCFNLAIDYDNLSGNNKESRSRELVEYFLRRNRLLDLQDAISAARPNVSWDEPTEISNVNHNLPQPEYERFIGREKEISRIEELLSPDTRHFIITIDGIGGIGKSTLALEIARRYAFDINRIPENERFVVIIWVSAKQTILTGEGISSRTQSLKTVDDIYSRIAIALEREDITRSPTSKQEVLIRHALTQQRTLLIIDNLESVDDDRIINFIRDVPSPTKVIVTTRHRLDIAYPIRLLALKEEEALALIADEAKRKEVVLSDNNAQHLFKHTSGVPLAIVWSIARMGFGYGVENVLDQLGRPTSNIAQFCFNGAVDCIRGQPAHKLLMALSLFPHDLDRDTIGHVCDLPERDRDDGLVELIKLSLANKTGNRFDLLPLTRTFSQHELRNDKLFVQQVIRRWVQRFTSLQENHTKWYWIQDQALILEEGENCRSVLDWAISFQDYETIFLIIKPSVLFLDYTGRRGESLILASDGKIFIQPYSKHGSISSWLSVKSAWIYSQYGSHDEAFEQIHEGIKGYQTINNDIGVCFANCFLAHVMRNAGRLTEAAQILEETIGMSAKLGYEEGIIIGYFELGKLARKHNDWEKAYSCFSNAYNMINDSIILNDIFSLTLIAIQGNFAEAALKSEKYREAKLLTTEAISVLNKWQHLGLATNYFGRMHLQAAEIEMLFNESSRAIDHTNQALKLFQSTRNQKGLKEANLLLNRIRS